MKKSILLLILSVTVGSGMGQTLKTYSGLYEGGKATYTYYEDENGERIKQGKFTYNKTQSGVGVGVGMIGGNISYTDTQYASGNYNKGKKNGEWIYKHKVASKNIVFSDFSAVINYVDGHMEGTLNSQGDIFQMKNNRITGKVKKIMKTRNENWTMSGQFDDDGFPDGVWIKRYQSYGNLYIDTEKYVHGLLVLKQTKNESTGNITRYEFEDVDPQEYISAYNSEKDSTIVGKLICQEKTYFKQGENNYSNLSDGLLPEVFGADVRTIVEKIKKENGFGLEQDKYEGIPFKEIVVIDKIEAPDEGKVYDVVKEMPQFAGGQEALSKYLKDNLNYPPQAKQQGIRGSVIVHFIINKDGSISNAKILRSVDELCDKEALRLINNMPKWIPGKSDGKVVRVRYTVSVSFSSNNS